MPKMFLARVPQTWWDTTRDLTGNGQSLFSIPSFSRGGKLFVKVLCPVKVMVSTQELLS